MFVAVQTAQYILRGRPAYGLQDVDGSSNATHIFCKFTRTLSPYAESFVENDGRARDGVDRDKLVDLKQPHYLYPIYSNEDLMTTQGLYTMQKRNVNEKV